MLVCTLSKETLKPFALMVLQGYNPSLYWPPDSAPSLSLPPDSQGRGQISDHSIPHCGTFMSDSQVTPLKHIPTPPPGLSGWIEDVLIAHGSPRIRSYQRVPSLHTCISFYIPHPMEQEKPRNPRNWHSGFPLNPAICTFDPFFLWALCLSPGFVEAALSRGQWLELTGQTGLVLRP